MARFAGGVHAERGVQVAQIHDHAHGGQPIHLKTFAGSPTGDIYQRSTAVDRERPVVEQLFDQADAGFFQCLVAESRGVHGASLPYGRVLALRLAQFIHSLAEGLFQDVIALLDHIRHCGVVPPAAVGCQVAHEIEQSAGAR